MNFFTRCALLSGALLGLSHAADAQVLLDNFENTRRIAYTYTDGVLVQNFANPAVGTGNPSPTVGQYTRSAGAQFDVIQIRPQSPVKFGDVSAYLAGTSTVTMKVYSTATGIPFQLVMQDKVKAATGYPNGNLAGTFNATTTVTNAWQTLTFTFAGGTSDPTVQPTDIDQLVLLINPNTNTNDVYLLDDLMGPAFATTPPPPPPAQITYDNFENIRLLSYTYTAGTLVQNAPNPATSPANPSPTVGQYTRNAGIQFDVIQFQPQLASKFGDASAYLAGTRSLTMKVYSPAVGIPFQLVMQDKVKAATGYPNGNLAGTFNATTTVANAWQTLTFVFTGGTSDPTVQPTDVNQMVLLINPNTNTADVYYLDDLMGPDFAPMPPTVVEQIYDDFEANRYLAYSSRLTSGNLNADTLNPAPSAANTSARVGRYTRSTSQYDALVARPTYRVIDVTPYLTNAKRMTLKVFSPAVGIPLQITMQDSSVANGGNYPTGRHSEYLATTTVANAWETITFTHSARPDPGVASTRVNEFVLLIAANTFVRQRFYLDDWYGPALQGVPTGLNADKAAAGLTAWPNPASDQASVRFTLRNPATVSVELFDLQGRRVASPLAAQPKAAGEQTVRFSTATLASGLYQYRVAVNGAVVSGKLSIVR